jgi:hypothetical protein
MAKKMDAAREAAEREMDGFEEPIDDKDDEGERPTGYDEDAAKAAGDALDEKIANDPRYESVPEGVADMQDSEREERAARAKGDPLRGFTQIERAQLEEFGIVKAGQNAGKKATTANAAQDLVRGLLALLGKSAPEPGPDLMGLDLAGPTDTEGTPIQRSGNFILVVSHGGKWDLHMFTNLDTVTGFAQRLQGLKRLFRWDGTKYQEINGQGYAVHR